MNTNIMKEAAAKRILLDRIKSKWRSVFKNYDLYLLLLPAIVYYIVFDYMPMLGVTVAFKDYNVFKGIIDSPWVGFKYFSQMLQMPDFYKIVRNTLTLNLLTLAVGFPAPIILALMLNELRFPRYKKTIQSILYLPHFMSWIILGGIISNLLSPEYGFVNHILKFMGQEPIFFLANEKWWIVTYIFSGVWSSAGWGTIIYLAALTGIDTSLYEAATVDGAGKWKQMTNITIPCLVPTIMVMLILRMGSIVSIGFEHPMALYNSLVSNVAQVISIFVYSAGLEQGRYSLTTAIGLLQSVINLCMVLLTNRISKMMGEDGLY